MMVSGSQLACRVTFQGATQIFFTILYVKYLNVLHELFHTFGQSQTQKVFLS
jgi:hypothetical protein